MKTSIIAGVVNNEVYEIAFDFGDRYFSMSGETYGLITEEEGIQEAEDYLSDGEAWRISVQNERTEDSKEDSKEDWNKYILQVDGWENIIDATPFDNTEYYKKWTSCGQHQEKELDMYVLPKEVLERMNTIWDTHHLKNTITQEDIDFLKKWGEQNRTDAVNSVVKFIEDQK